MLSWAFVTQPPLNRALAHCCIAQQQIGEYADVATIKTRLLRCSDRVGTIESLHCGDGVVDDARFLGRDVNGNAAVDAHCSLDGLASSLAVQFRGW